MTHARLKEPKQLEIVIKGNQGSGKTTVFNIITEALEKAGYRTINLLPIPILGMEDRAMSCNETRTIQIITQEKEAQDV